MSCRGEQLGTNFIEWAESPECFRFGDIARESAGDERVGAHGQVESDLVVGLDFDAAAAANRKTERATSAWWEHRPFHQAGCGVLRMPFTVSA